MVELKIAAIVGAADEKQFDRLLKQVKTLKPDEILAACPSSAHSRISKKYGAKTIKDYKTRPEFNNKAAKRTKSDVLVFIHRNTIKLPPNLFNEIKQVMQNPQGVGGGVYIAFNSPHRFLKMVAWLSNNYRMRLRKIIFHDQMPFVIQELDIYV